jgi:hypothetical protein
MGYTQLVGDSAFLGEVVAVAGGGLKLKHTVHDYGCNASEAPPSRKNGIVAPSALLNHLISTACSFLLRLQLEIF